MPPHEIKLSDEQVKSIADQIVAAHPCFFAEDERRNVHRIVQAVDGDNWHKWEAVMNFGGTLIEIRKAGIVAMVVIIVGAVCGALWAGIKIAVTVKGN